MSRPHLAILLTNKFFPLLNQISPGLCLQPADCPNFILAGDRLETSLAGDWLALHQPLLLIIPTGDRLGFHSRRGPARDLRLPGTGSRSSNLYCSSYLPGTGLGFILAGDRLEIFACWGPARAPPTCTAHHTCRGPAWVSFSLGTGSRSSLAGDRLALHPSGDRPESISARN